jgi:hypothetical protein
VPIANRNNKEESLDEIMELLVLVRLRLLKIVGFV